MKSIRIGTRSSPLAMYQAELVRSLLIEQLPSLTVELVPIKTSGDAPGRERTQALETKRIFTREIEDALIAESIDAAVHSAKDLAAVLPRGLTLAAALKREDPRDCLVSDKALKLSELPPGARIGTGALRRQRQILRMRPDLEVLPLEGNVQTRLRKLDEGQYDAIILAAAGLKRLELHTRIADYLDGPGFFPAPCQGVITVQTRANHDELNKHMATINHAETHTLLRAERAFLARLDGGCQLPCGARVELEGNVLAGAGALFSISDDHAAIFETSGDSSDPEVFGTALADGVLANGGRAILEEIKS